MTTDNSNDQGVEIDRRTLIKTTGAVAATAAVGATGTGSTAAKLPVIGGGSGGISVGVDDFTFSPANYVVEELTNATDLLGGPLDVLTDNTQEIANVGNVSLHERSISAYSSFEKGTNEIKNWLNDARMAANIAARDAVARAYENGESRASAKQAAHDAIKDHLSISYRNYITVGTLLALRLAKVSKTADETSEISANWDFWLVADNDYSGSGSIKQDQTQIVPTTTTAEFELPNGKTQELETVRFQAAWDNGDEWSTTVDKAFIDQYNQSSDSWTFTTDQGNEFTTDFTGSTVSVPSSNLPSRRVLTLNTWADTLQQIDQTVTDLVGNYPDSFIGNLYTALDDGTIDPVDVRGVEGTAEFLSGSTDATEGRYQIALSSVLDGVRPDLSTTSEMQVEITGYTDALLYGDGTQQLRDFVEEKPEVGMLFARNLPEQGIQSGKTYASNLPIVVARNANDNLKLLDAADGEVIWSFNSPFSIDSVAPLPSGDRIVTAGRQAKVMLLDAADGTEIWTSSVPPNQVYSVAPLPSGDSIVTGSRGGGIKLLDAADGTEIWSNTSTNGSIESVAPLPSGDQIITATRSEGAKLLDAADGTEIWRWNFPNSSANTVYAVEPLPSGDRIVIGSGEFGDDTVKLLDAADGTEIWTSSSTAPFTTVAPMPSGDRIVAGANATVSLLNAADGTEIWSSTAPSNTVNSVAPLPSGDRIVIGSEDQLKLLDAADGTEIWSSLNTSVASVAPMLYQRSQAYEPTAGRLSGEFHAIQPPEETETEGEEIDVERVRGKIKITEIIDSDGSEVTDPVSWERPKYDSFDTQEYANYLDRVSTEYADALNQAGDPAIGGVGGINLGDGFLDGLPSLPGFTTLESGVIVAVGAWVAGQLSN